MSDLDALFPPPAVVTVAGREIVISPLPIRQFVAFGQACGPFLPLIASADYLMAAQLHTDSVIAALSIAARVEPQWLETLTADEIVELMAAVFETNADFFARRLLPLQDAARARMIKLLTAAQAGQLSSPGSASGGTASPTAETSASAS